MIVVLLNEITDYIYKALHVSLQDPSRIQAEQIKKIYSTFPSWAAITAMTVHIRFSASGNTNEASL